MLIDEICIHPLWKELNNKYIILPISPASYPYCEYEKIKAIPKINLSNIDPLLNKDSHPFHSNTDENRLEVLNKALYSDEKNLIIWCINGGYGSSKLIKFLDKQIKPKIEKIFIGYSDVTALHLFLSQKWGWKTIHGACLGELFKNNKNANNFIHVLNLVLNNRRTVNDNYFSDIIPLNISAKKFKDKFDNYELTGGNLAIIQTSFGTNWQINIKDKILFLEDVGEEGYKVDRMLYHLKSTLELEDVKAIVFGEFIKSDEYMNFAINDFANQNSEIPMYITNKIGHGKNNFPVVYNKKGLIDIKLSP
jgi:muramoyltetrapeptide carboxypeptidase